MTNFIKLASLDLPRALYALPDVAPCFDEPPVALGAWDENDSFERVAGPSEPQSLALCLELLIALVQWCARQEAAQPAQDRGNLPQGKFAQQQQVSKDWGSGQGSGPADKVAVEPQGEGKVSDFLNVALKQQGDNYVFGSETKMDDADPNTFDCSELVEWAANQVGVEVPDGSSNQKSHCTPVSVEDALRTPGALLFRPGHVAISLGDGRTIEARGKSYGVGVFDAKNRFTSGGIIPGLA